ncbi:hypothetical protein [Actinoplanes sp. NPDC051859]|uniref:hypothetical protein n=1 Tax=Actinoplanes sp. NPDC051859 TaxID=3363909 RepID=UPI0037BABE93
MDLDIAHTAASAVPYIMATAAAYGMGTVDRVRDRLIDKASDASVSVGHRILNVLLRRDNPVLEEAVEDVAAGGEESDAVLRVQIRKALTADPELAREVAAMIPVASRATFIGMQHNSGSGTFIGGNNHGNINPPITAS